MFTTVCSAAVYGLQAYLVRVEVDLAGGLPSFQLVGSLGSEVKESRERVSVAMKNSGFQIPPAHITVNLAPAGRRKDGTAFDLPIAVGLLRDMELVPEEALQDTLFLGELGLNGEIKKVKGVLPIVQEAAKSGIRRVVVPGENAMEAAVIPGITVWGVNCLNDLLAALNHPELETEKVYQPRIRAEDLLREGTGQDTGDFREVAGQENAKRGAEIAAAGFHNLLMIGPPGVGKSMVAGRIPGILPPLTLKESLEVTGIFSVAGLLPPTSGDITIGEKSILGEKGYVGYMLQKDMLLPWRTIIDNIILGLEIKGVPKREARKQALPLMEKYGLSGFEKNYPCELSGGMRQRAALLRTLLYDREIILLDEPFGALDAQTRQSMQNWLLEIWEDFHKTVLFVTHDMDEAIYLSDIIYVFSGRPGYVKEKITVHLKRPRKQEDMLETDFWDLKQHLMGGMSNEKRSV